MNTVTIDGSKKTWPARLDGVEVSFPSIPEGATVEDAVGFLRANATSDNAVVGFLRGSLEARQASDLRRKLNAKLVEPGKKYERGEKAKLPQVSEKISKADVVAFGPAWKLEEMKKGTGVAARLRVAEEKARRNESQLSAANTALIETLRKLPKKEAEKSLADLITAKILPEGTTL